MRIATSTREISDIWFAAYLVLNGVPLKETSRGSSTRYVNFVFDRTKDFDRLLGNYVSGDVLVPLRRLIEVYRQLRDLTHASTKGDNNERKSCRSRGARTN